MTRDRETQDTTPPEGFVTTKDDLFGKQSFRPPSLDLRQDGDIYYLRQSIELQDYPDSVLDFLIQAERAFPDRLAIAERTKAGWHGPSYREFLAACRSVAQGFLDRGLGQGDCVAIISRNSIIHAQIMLGAMMAGVAVAPISPSYARFAEAFSRLESTFAQARAKVFFVDDAQAISDALAKLDLSGCEVVSERPRPGDTDVADLLITQATDRVDAAQAAVSADTVAKILFTSGSTGSPKGVINTHGMICANLVMSKQVSIHVPHAHRRSLCWLPWHHTFGGNIVLLGTLRVGGTLYIDTGRPVAGADFQRTLDALRDIRPTHYSNVPLAYSMLTEAMERDSELASAFFSNLTFLHYGGAGFPEDVYARLQDIAVAQRGCRIPVSGGFAMTETAPSAMAVHWPYDGVGRVGMPLPGVEAKLLPLGDDRYELRLRGPNVFPGYVDQPELNKKIFDDEGYFRTGDAMRFDDLSDFANNLRYAGRVSEDFKLDSGTFVQVNAIRTGILEHCGDLTRDAVVVGEGRRHITVLVWLTEAARSRAVGAKGDLLDLSPGDLARMTDALTRWNSENSGSSRQIRSIGVLAEPPNMSENEINDKGYVNQRQVLRRRAQTVEQLYDGTAGNILIHAEK